MEASQLLGPQIRDQARAEIHSKNGYLDSENLPEGDNYKLIFLLLSNHNKGR